MAAPCGALVEPGLPEGIGVLDLGAHRLKDLADVIELIRAASLPSNLADALDPSVRDKYLELWTAAQATDPE